MKKLFNGFLGLLFLAVTGIALADDDHRGFEDHHDHDDHAKASIVVGPPRHYHYWNHRRYYYDHHHRYYDNDYHEAPRNGVSLNIGVHN
jgi:hypothetical protein